MNPNGVNLPSDPAARVRLTSESGRFSVEMPGPPVESSAELPSPLGPVTTRSYTVEDRDGMFVASYADFPGDLGGAGAADERLDGACMGMVMNVRGILRQSQNVDQSGVEGRELVYDFPGPYPGARGFGRARLFLVGNRLYQVFVIGVEGRVRSDEAREFLDSFCLDVRPAPTLICGPHPTGPTPPSSRPDRPTIR